VTVAGVTNPETGLLIDFHDLERAVQERVLAVVDHRDLNDILTNPTAEHLVGWMWRRLEGHVDGLDEIDLWETERYRVTYRGEGA
jgi:6-pyruvoyl-tetrahydropterin synthase